MYDVIVIGAGVNGSAAAHALSKEKKNILLLEQVGKFSFIIFHFIFHFSFCFLSSK